MRIPGLRGQSPFAILKDAVQRFVADDMITRASALAYEVLFSLFPFIIFLIALLGFLGLPGFFDWLRMHAQLVFPREAMQPINQVINDLQEHQGGLLSVGVIVALWSASAATRATM